MAECPKTLTGIEVSCEAAAGGIKRVLVAPRESIITPTLTNSEEGGKEILADAFKAVEENVAFVEYKFRPQTGSMTSTSTIDTAIGSSSITTVLTLQFTKMEQTKRVAIQQAINTGSAVIVEQYDGTKFFLGYDMPVYATSATAVTGQAIGDLNGYTLELTDVSFELPYIVNASEEELNALKVSVPMPSYN